MESVADKSKLLFRLCWFGLFNLGWVVTTCGPFLEGSWLRVEESVMCGLYYRMEHFLVIPKVARDGELLRGLVTAL